MREWKPHLTKSGKLLVRRIIISSCSIFYKDPDVTSYGGDFFADYFQLSLWYLTNNYSQNSLCSRASISKLHLGISDIPKEFCLLILVTMAWKTRWNMINPDEKLDHVNWTDFPLFLYWYFWVKHSRERKDEIKSNFYLPFRTNHI
jgi:hypothetical protein